MTDLIRARDVQDVLHQHGAHRSTLVGYLTRDEVHALAEEYRTDNEVDGTPLADALVELVTAEVPR